MGLLTFEDEQGNRWQVWDVHPTTVERRINERTDFPPELDRRQTDKPRFTLPPTLRTGWLAFQCGGENRRLAPIPPNWECTDDGALRALLRSALPAPVRERAPSHNLPR